MSQDTEYQSTFLELIEPLWGTDGLTDQWSHDMVDMLKDISSAHMALSCLYRHADTRTQQRVPLFVAGMLCAKAVYSVPSALMKTRLALAYTWASHDNDHLRGMLLDEQTGLPPDLTDTGKTAPGADNNLGRAVYWHAQDLARTMERGDRTGTAQAMSDIAEAYCYHTAQHALASIDDFKPGFFGKKPPPLAGLQRLEDTLLRKIIVSDLLGTMSLHMILQTPATQVA